MAKVSHRAKPALLAGLAAMLLQACDGGSSAPQPGVNGTYLYVSAEELYFGTRDVGTTARQEISIANRGADRYPLKSLTVTGDNSEEFAIDVFEEVVLEPAQAIMVGISFVPITENQKSAQFVVDYETIQMVDESVNINEQNYYQGKMFEDQGDFQSASESYSNYIEGKPVTVNKRRAAIKLPVIDEAKIYGDGEDFDLYLSAINNRDYGELNASVSDLETLQILYPDSYLADDSLYMQGYIQLMDEKDYAGALRTMQQLRQSYPDTTYYDTALYVEALAQQ